MKKRIIFEMFSLPSHSFRFKSEFNYVFSVTEYLSVFNLNGVVGISCA